jgi:hypothetical protein
VAGFSGTGLFTEGALKCIWEFSEGTPRKINLICDNALVVGYGRNIKQIDDDIIRDVEKEMIGALLPSPGFQHSTEKTIASQGIENVSPAKNRNERNLSQSDNSIIRTDEQELISNLLTSNDALSYPGKDIASMQFESLKSKKENKDLKARKVIYILATSVIFILLIYSFVVVFNTDLLF